LFARVIDIRPDIVILLREVGLVYLSFNVYFLLLAEKPKLRKQNQKAVKETFSWNASFRIISFQFHTMFC
jgi:hypothetical protein